MREEDSYRDKAVQQAWNEIQNQLVLAERKFGFSSFELQSIRYQGDTFLSRVEELPDDPIAPLIHELVVTVGIDAYYRIGK